MNTYGMSPQVLPLLQRHCLYTDVDVDVRCRGYYPAGGGEVRVRVPSLASSKRALGTVALRTRGEVTALHAVAVGLFLGVYHPTTCI